MAYQSSGKLGMESASKLGHLELIQSEWIQELVKDFESDTIEEVENSTALFQSFDPSKTDPLSSIWVVDGSYTNVTANPPTGKEVAFVKAALMYIDNDELSQIDKKRPHPMKLKKIRENNASFHGTVFPLKNVKTKKGNILDTIRHIIFESIKLDQGGEYFETLKWLVYKKWNKGERVLSPDFACPKCDVEIDGFPFDSEKMTCEHCSAELLLTDMIGFHHEMDEEFANLNVATAYMMIIELVILFTPIRILWEKNRKKFSETLFIKDGPLTLRSQYAKLVPLIREFIEYTKSCHCSIHLIGQEKSGKFREYLTFIEKHVPPQQTKAESTFLPLSHEFVRNEVTRTGPLSTPYGKRTNYGEKVFVKVNPSTSMVLNIPTGLYNDADFFPKADDLVGLNKILSTIPDLISYMHEGALYPIALANGVSSLSNYPSNNILTKFIE